MKTQGNYHASEHDWRYEAAANKAEDMEASQNPTADEGQNRDYGYRVAFKQWDRGKGDYMALVEHSTKWMSHQECLAWIDSHHWDEAKIIERSGRILGTFGDSQSPATNKEQAQKHFSDRETEISGKFLLSRPTPATPADPASEAGAGAHTPDGKPYVHEYATHGFNEEPNQAQLIPTSKVDELLQELTETAVERDRLRRLLADETKALDEAIDDYGKVVIQRYQAREQVKTLMAMLEQVTTAAEIIDGSEKPTSGDIEYFLDCCERSHRLQAAIASVENAKESEGQ